MVTELQSTVSFERQFNLHCQCACTAHDFQLKHRCFGSCQVATKFTKFRVMISGLLKVGCFSRKRGNAVCLKWGKLASAFVLLVICTFAYSQEDYHIKKDIHWFFSISLQTLLQC